MSSIDYQRLTFTYQPCAEQSAATNGANGTNDTGRTAAPHPVIVVGAGPVGLATAIDLAHQGVHVIVLDDDCTLSTGSRAICFAKRTLDIFDRLGCGDRMVQKGVCWNVGRVFLRDQEVYNFDLLPDAGHHRPAFINLQQYYVEGYLFERASELPNIEIRWKNKVSGLVQHGTPGAADASVTLTVDTPDGAYQTTARYVVAADGSRSPVRKLIGVDSHGRTFKDRFLIADVKMTANFPAERWFWFDPPFHPNQSVLLHRQPDDVWRIDFQLGWDADPEAEKTPERVIPRVQALLGPDAKFTLEWVSVYTFSCLRMDSFRHGNVLFAGDSAHGVSPFGARGANSGVQDAENLAWKLAMVLDDRAPDTLLDTYAREREFAADENILNSTRATDFITPKSPVSRVFRDAVLTLARDHAFARQLVNSGRLSVPAVLHDSTLNTADRDTFVGRMVPGATCLDAPLSRNAQDGWLLPRLGGRFVALVFGSPASLDAVALAALQAMANDRVPVMPVFVTNDASQAQGDENVWHDAQGLAAQRYDATPGTVYLVRPDQHVCARWRTLDAAAIAQARDRALGRVSSAQATMPCAA
ncbi:FAD-dependent oxidoreductase [Pandoraea sp. PE-S2R-1]|uniref:FAD-dependent oxidoreductase n=1 Tax=Pandoraea sp. PE-S2R-1 TaxID=1986994 RepID=UPI000B3FDE17|nr:FAD-dependent oxidoreductase [Pandoraea sp. PE-S2R-1]